jgi:hypothetical protein
LDYIGKLGKFSIFKNIFFYKNNNKIEFLEFLEFFEILQQLFSNVCSWIILEYLGKFIIF